MHVLVAAAGQIDDDDLVLVHIRHDLHRMKPITINAMVAGVQAGRINADVFISFQSFRWRQPNRLRGIEMGRAKQRFKTIAAKTGQAAEMIVSF